MARPGQRPTSNKSNFATQPGVPANQKQNADEFNWLTSKSNEPGQNTAWSSVVKFDDEYFPPEHTMSGPITYTIDGTNAGTGNGRVDQVVGNGDTITFAGFTIRKSDLTVSTDTVTTVSGNTYTIVFLRRGSVSEVYLSSNQSTPSFALSLSNFRIENADPDRVYFDTNQAPIGTTYAGFTLANPSKTITGITFNTGNTTGHYFTVSTPYIALDTGATIAYDGTDDWTGTGGALAAFSAQAITNNIGLTQLSAVTLGTVTPSTGQVTISVTNPNSSNETQNQLYYKLNTEPTTWTTGAVMATGGTSVIQTGLTDGLLYNFKMVAEGDGVTYSDSPDSNIVNGTPGTSIETSGFFMKIDPAQEAYTDLGQTSPATNDGDGVASIKSVGATASSFSQTVSDSRPTLKTNIINGLPVLRFDSGDWMGSSADSWGTTTTPMTIMVVAMTNTANAQATPITSYGSPLDSGDIDGRMQTYFDTRAIGDNPVTGIVNDTPSTGSIICNRNDALSTGTFQVLTFVYDRGTEIRSFINTTKQTDTETVGNLTLRDLWKIGGGAGNLQRLNGDFAIAYSWKSALSDSDVVSYAGELVTRFGL